MHGTLTTAEFFAELEAYHESYEGRNAQRAYELGWTMFPYYNPTDRSSLRFCPPGADVHISTAQELPDLLGEKDLPAAWARVEAVLHEGWRPSLVLTDTLPEAWQFSMARSQSLDPLAPQHLTASGLTEAHAINRVMDLLVPKKG